MNDNTRQRWRAKITYRSERGPIDVHHTFEEIEDLHDIIERGPHWDAIISCKITLNVSDEDARSLTIEEAARL